LPFVEGDIRDTDLLALTLKSYGAEAVIHFAGLKAVGESVQNPLEY
jgi:UDP-glucose 4-epimerase